MVTLGQRIHKVTMKMATYAKDCPFAILLFGEITARLDGKVLMTTRGDRNIISTTH